MDLALVDTSSFVSTSVTTAPITIKITIRQPTATDNNLQLRATVSVFEKKKYSFCS